MFLEVLAGLPPVADFFAGRLVVLPLVSGGVFRFLFVGVGVLVELLGVGPAAAVAVVASPADFSGASFGVAAVGCTVLTSFLRFFADPGCASVCAGCRLVGFAFASAAAGLAVPDSWRLRFLSFLCCR